jgi:hypothetical protein
MNTLDIKVGTKIGFRYKGNRHVVGIVMGDNGKEYTIELLTDYRGKNNEWYTGDHKVFNKKEMKKISNQ